MLNQYLHLEAALNQHSTSPWASPLVIIPQKGLFGTHPRLDSPSNLPLPRVDGILDSLYKGKIFSTFNFNFNVHPIVTDPDTIPLTAVLHTHSVVRIFWHLAGRRSFAVLICESHQQGRVWPGPCARVLPRRCHLS